MTGTAAVSPTVKTDMVLEMVVTTFFKVVAERTSNRQMIVLLKPPVAYKRKKRATIEVTMVTVTSPAPKNDRP